MGTCHMCDKPDGWNHQMRSHTDEPVVICITCYRAGCQKCGLPFDRTERKPVEHLFRGPDGDPDEAEVWCLKCEKKAKRGRARD